MVSMRFATLDCKLAGTSCTTETIPTIRMALARIISRTEKPFCSLRPLVKSQFAFADCILTPAFTSLSRGRPWGLPNLGLAHQYDGDRSKPVLVWICVCKHQKIWSGCAGNREIYRSAVIKRNGARKILSVLKSGARHSTRRAAIHNLHVTRQHHEWLARVQFSISIHIDKESGVVRREEQAYDAVTPNGSVSRQSDQFRRLLRYAV